MPTYNPAHIFVHAEQFRAAARWLPEAQKHKFLYPVDMAVPVCSAFALELYFKCLLVISGNLIPPEHDLKKLFNKLIPSHKARIKQLSEAYMGDLRIWLTEEHKKIGKPVPTIDVNYVLRASKNAFEMTRYLYETGLPEGRGWIADTIVEGTRDTILELHPEWEGRRTNIQLTMRTLPTVQRH
jgi:hypothetical protein